MHVTLILYQQKYRKKRKIKNATSKNNKTNNFINLTRNQAQCILMAKKGILLLYTVYKT